MGDRRPCGGVVGRRGCAVGPQRGHRLLPDPHAGHAAEFHLAERDQLRELAGQRPRLLRDIAGGFRLRRRPGHPHRPAPLHRLGHHRQREGTGTDPRPADVGLGRDRGVAAGAASALRRRRQLGGIRAGRERSPRAAADPAAPGQARSLQRGPGHVHRPRQCLAAVRLRRAGECRLRGRGRRRPDLARHRAALHDRPAAGAAAGQDRAGGDAPGRGAEVAEQGAGAQDRRLGRGDGHRRRARLCSQAVPRHVLGTGRGRRHRSRAARVRRRNLRLGGRRCGHDRSVAQHAAAAAVGGRRRRDLGLRRGADRHPRGRRRRQPSDGVVVAGGRRLRRALRPAVSRLGGERLDAAAADRGHVDRDRRHRRGHL